MILRPLHHQPLMLTLLALLVLLLASPRPLHSIIAVADTSVSTSPSTTLRGCLPIVLQQAPASTLPASSTPTLATTSSQTPSAKSDPDAIPDPDPLPDPDVMPDPDMMPDPDAIPALNVTPDPDVTPDPSEMLHAARAAHPAIAVIQTPGEE